MTENDFEETLQSANNRIKSDIENMYNLSMRVKMSSLTTEKLELLREIEQRMEKTHRYIIETIKTYDKE